MNNEDLIEQIEEQHGRDKKDQSVLDDKIEKFIVFQIAEKKYALYANDIREIILDYPLFYVPFVPPYVRGFINRHGEPYTVLDLNALFEQVKLDSAAFMVINRESDQLAFVISEILEIAKLTENNIHLITEDTGDEGFFQGSITLHEQEIFIVNLDKVLERLERDIGS